ncbi:MAG: outer membrane lipid asymmetry maintenance protein MlaD [Rhodospirillales bacterium 69-11]|nr:outer membrane lipid asymmetry maintenance protein MlaD [Rhodospirillales bacterium]OJW25761.1 MAG: outer membrane lipid asymmetry maintenance protein MlaD [Rhodospirillales bacterium 69-11]
MPRRSIAEVLTGAVVLLVAAGFLAYAVAHSGRSTASGYPLHAQFDHIDGLGPGSDVRIAGVKVGSVTGTHLDPKTYFAIVDLTVRDDVKLPKDSSAEITSESLLGGKFLALVPGGDETMLKPGQAITITQGSISLEQLLGKFIFSVTSLKPNASGGDAGGSGTGGAGSGGAGNGGAASGGAGSGGTGLPPLSPAK